MENTFISVRYEGVKEIEFIEAKKSKKYAVYEIGMSRVKKSFR